MEKFKGLVSPPTPGCSPPMGWSPGEFSLGTQKGARVSKVYRPLKKKGTPLKKGPERNSPGYNRAPWWAHPTLGIFPPGPGVLNGRVLLNPGWFPNPLSSPFPNVNGVGRKCDKTFFRNPPKTIIRGSPGWSILARLSQYNKWSTVL